MRKKPQIEDWYQQIVKEKEPPRPVLKNCLWAFFSGGLLCALAQSAYTILYQVRGMSEDLAVTAVVISVILLAALLTGIGVYDRLAQKAGAGLAVPISGFANSLTAAALEHRSEGLVLGSGCNSFKLAGAVVVYGIVAAVLVALLALVFGLA